jgi:uncharacterized membrane protein YqhA
MKIIIERSRYLSLAAVLALLATFALALFWGVARAVVAWGEILFSYGKSPEISLLLIKLIDAFLIAIVLYMLAASIYSLFYGELDLPSRLVARSLPELKSKLSSLMVLVIAVRFVEALFEENLQPARILALGAAVSLVAGTLIAFSYFGNKDKLAEE